MKKPKAIWKKWWFWVIIVLFLSINSIINHMTETEDGNHSRTIHSNIPSH